MKVIVHKGTGTYFPIDSDVYVVDVSEIEEMQNDRFGGFDAEFFEEELDIIITDHGKPVGISMREQIPCSWCNKPVWDDNLYAHVDTGEYYCGPIRDIPKESK